MKWFYLIFFQEINDVNPEQRDATFGYGSKFIGYALAIEGVLRCVTAIELIECREIVE